MRRAREENCAVTEAASNTIVMLAQLVVALMVALVAVGAAWYGFSAEVRERLWHNLLDRPGGPMTFRFILQPIMAMIAALYDGVRDARTGRSPYLWTILADPAERGGRLREGLISTARVSSSVCAWTPSTSLSNSMLFIPRRRSSSRSCWPLSPIYCCVALAHESLAGGTAPHLRTKSSEGAFHALVII